MIQSEIKNESTLGVKRHKQQGEKLEENHTAERKVNTVRT